MSKYDDLQKHMLITALGVVPTLNALLPPPRILQSGRGFEQHYPCSGPHIDNAVYAYQSQVHELYAQWQKATLRWREASERVKANRKPFDPRLL